MLMIFGLSGASFNNLLDALDAAYCTSDGGDDPNEDGELFLVIAL